MIRKLLVKTYWENFAQDASYIAGAVCDQEYVHYAFTTSVEGVNGIVEFMDPKFIQEFHSEIWKKLSNNSSLNYMDVSEGNNYIHLK